ncbi:sensor histidine kinase [Micromonospora endophytica]|uniref:histidine kinase n=1 Tax=Micromonospora endophytica TaxID=515350 RepID=A0A2W2CFI1_9ACTN|nr:HAMP domain-containing sensor histidine kinase [Micromonospora endophytica]PZF91704.1 sensor histidine kinase [Micromonospora endophytica]RIW42011.1 sensor histidine kinase [Micromonospora endophytica]BCJ56811.1 sensor protein CutS [Micromonospora endophytica]
MRLFRSIRFRLTVLYSTLLFALAGTGLAVAYVAVDRAVDPKPITKRYEAHLVKLKSDGRTVPTGTTLEVAEVQQIEDEVNLRLLQTVRDYSLIALGGLFVASLGIGWVLSGRALRPVGSIVRTTREIQATDLSRRIRLSGPRDELRDLGDTIDSMLDRLDHAFRAQRQLIDDASHELRSPLAIIRANLDASLTSPEATDAERAAAVATVDRATTRMSRLVEDLLATARRDTDSMADTDIDLSAVAQEAGEDFTPLAAERGLRLRYALGADLVLIGDPDALRRAAANLLSNAVRLSPLGGAISVATGRVGGWLWLAVVDEGPGIALPDQARVFDRFWRGEGSRGGSGDRRTGLGLAIVRQIVESHGGQAAVHSVPGAGSTFVLWLPAADRDDDSPPPASSPA